MSYRLFFCHPQIKTNDIKINFCKSRQNSVKNAGICNDQRNAKLYQICTIEQVSSRPAPFSELNLNQAVDSTEEKPTEENMCSNLFIFLQKK